MADVRWRLLALIVVVMATKTQAIDQKELGRIVKQVLQRLHLNRTQPKDKLPMFSVAVNVPKGHNGQYDVNLIPDPRDKIRNTILKCHIYEGEHAVAATVLRWPNVLTMCPEEKVPWKDVLRKCKRYPKSSMTWQQVKDKCPDAIEDKRADHAEYRVLDTFKTWVARKKKTDKTGLMLFYVFGSPCTDRCTHETNKQNILELVQNINQWSQHVLVFSKVFQYEGQESTQDNDRKDALKRLGGKIGGLGNIFQCAWKNGDMRCASCSGGGGQVTPECYQGEQGKNTVKGGGTQRGRGQKNTVKGGGTKRGRG
ncbi:uncharacterized protein LOC133633473 [Entelurus aequoreus]|uniref:uncharacterized protein LOC133633473 n=1 Tax=Entelurus aequoreus TaxID=161455 RepID=UPI002B1D7EC8|nr:uncharacterized protein LOC133633473 [Entelurus aequoreus]